MVYHMDDEYASYRFVQFTEDNMKEIMKLLGISSISICYDGDTPILHLRSKGEEKVVKYGDFIVVVRGEHIKNKELITSLESSEFKKRYKHIFSGIV